MTDKRIPYGHGVDVKRFQYEEYAENLCFNRIDLNHLIEKHLIGHPIDTNCVMINIEKDVFRYNNCVEEFKKIGFNNFVHLKATYWKEREKFISDLNFVLDFLKQFNPAISSTKVELDLFSNTSDPAIWIQDGPLACYVSHLRSLIYGYTHFNDYTIVVEDDILIANTEYIEKYLAEIPPDWDIVCLNSIPKSKTYEDICYRFTDDFHSSHFAIYNNRCLPYLFSKLYPITDQVDVLVSNECANLKIYNITETVYQRNFRTNTQNNLHVIFNSPHYEPIRHAIDKICDLIEFFIHKIIPNCINATELALDLVYDVIYEYLIEDPDYIATTHPNKEITYHVDVDKYLEYLEYPQLLEHVTYFLQCGKKGIDLGKESRSLVNVILHTLENFKLDLKALSFGSTSHVYLDNNGYVVKQYNDKLRWVADGHDDSCEIFNKEIKILNRVQHLDFVPKLLDYNASERKITLSYCGESLYSNFKLPSDWESQISSMFDKLDESEVYYPEFNLKNILILGGKIKFVDYGLAELKKIPNDKNLFTSRLTALNNRLGKEPDPNLRRQLYTTFMQNV